MDKVPWNPVIYKEFVSLSFLTPEEEKILRTRINGWNQVAQIDELHISLATLNRRISAIKGKYIAAQQHSKILPDIDSLDF